MGFNSKSKNYKLDRISSLPDVIASHILSYLPTKYAVRTSILSKTWKYRWTSIINLDFEDDSFLGLDEFEHDSILGGTGFIYFVYRVLHLCNSSQIQKFRLCFHNNIQPCHVSEWIVEAIRRNVRELDLLDCYISKLPYEVFLCETLAVLKLVTDNIYSFFVPDDLCLLPNLKILHIHVYNPRNDMTKKLFRICPLLEDLIIEGHVATDTSRLDDYITIYDVSAPALKRLVINIDGTRDEVTHKIVINAPNLEYLNLNVLFRSEYTLKNLSSLVEAIVNVGDRRRHWESAIHVFEILRGISSIKSLALYKHTMLALDYLYRYKLPTFDNLTMMEQEFPAFRGWRVMLNLLESSPNLEVLILKKEYDDEDDGDTVPIEEFAWIEPDSVPNCLLFHLEVIKMTIFKGKEYELKVLKYLLAHAEALKKLAINFCGLTSEEEVEFGQKLLEFPRASSSSIIEMF